MNFQNENTFNLERATLDRSFEGAIEKVKGEFGGHFPLLIGGQEVFSDQEITTFSPIDRRLTIGHFQKANIKDVRQAILSAMDAFKEAWRDYGWRQRVKIMRNAASLMSTRKFELAAILSFENGKTRNESLGEVDEAIDFLRYYSVLIEDNKGLIIERTITSQGPDTAGFGHQGAISPGEKVSIISKPFGVWVVIAPFNFPVSISTGMCSAALITGNTVVFKPSLGDNPTPMTGLKVCRLLIESGLPRGAINFITGLGGEIGNELVSNPGVAGIAFTGSRVVAAGIQRKIAAEAIPKQFVAEMGSKNPAIVSDSADLDEAANGVASAAFGYCGQKCSACSRTIVQEKVYDRFVETLKSKVSSMTIGNPLERGVYLGPLIGESAFKRYQSSMERATNEGRIVYGGHRLASTELFINGFYVEPAIIEVSTDSALFQQELFLPVLALAKYAEFSQAIGLANATQYGLTAGLYSHNQEEIDCFNKEINFGTTYVNRRVSATTGAVVGLQTFVGCKASSVTCKGTSSLSYLLQFVKEHSQTVVG